MNNPKVPMGFSKQKLRSILLNMMI